MSNIIFAPDSLRTQVEAASGGHITVLYDDKGYPSYMRRIPKFRYEDLGFSGDPFGTGLATCFLKNGQEVSELLIGQYQASVYDGRACSLPGKDPTVYINFDDSRAACADKGPGWHLMTMHEWAAIALWCMANGFQPRGNTDFGRAHDAHHETALRADGGTPGIDDAGDEPTYTGSGPASWRHDGKIPGIADLVGNIWEWQDGLKLVDGQFVCTPDNDFSAAEGSWIAQSTHVDSPAAGTTSDTGSLGNPELADSVSNYAGPQGDNGSYGYNSIDPWSSMTTAAGYTPNTLMQRLLIEPSGVAPQGYFVVRNYGERMPRRGGYWHNGGSAGLAALNLRNHRSLAVSNLGLRPAFVA